MKQKTNVPGSEKEAMLTGGAKEASVSAIGDINAISGYSIAIYDEAYFGLEERDGIIWIYWHIFDCIVIWTYKLVYWS